MPIYCNKIYKPCIHLDYATIEKLMWTKSTSTTLSALSIPTTLVNIMGKAD